MKEEASVSAVFLDFMLCEKTILVPSHQLAWKCKLALSKGTVVFLQGSVHFHVSWWEGKPNVWARLLANLLDRKGGYVSSVFLVFDSKTWW